MVSGRLAMITAALLVSTAAARADVEISAKPTSNMSCDAGVCTATASKAVLNVGDLATMLASGDVAVKTGLVAKDIDIDQPLQWRPRDSSARCHRADGRIARAANPAPRSPCPPATPQNRSWPLW